jgi:hypothetical protein
VALGLLLVLLGTAGALTVTSLPELQRYLKIRAM